MSGISIARGVTATDASFGSPGPIGNVTPSTVTGTTITATTAFVGPQIAAGATGGVLSFSNVAGAGPSITAGIAATAVTGLNVTQTIGIGAGNAALATASPFGIQWTWNDANAITGVKWVVTDTSSGAGSLPFQILGGPSGATLLSSVNKQGGIGVRVNAGSSIGVDVLGTSDSFNNAYIRVKRGAASSDAVILTVPSTALSASTPQFAYGIIGSTNYFSFQSYDGTIITAPLMIATDGALNIKSTGTGISEISPGRIGIGTGAAGSTAGSISLTTLTHASAEVDASYSYNTPTTGATITTATGEQRTIIKPAGTIAALTVTTPPSPVDGQIWGAACSQIVTALTITGTAGATVVAPVSSFAVDGNFRMIYRAAITSWLPAP